ncbi:MAG: MFS transporter [Fusobacteria bacterium]|nr:MFS transporter [Fusobacteriota bacterium]
MSHRSDKCRYWFSILSGIMTGYVLGVVLFAFPIIQADFKLNEIDISYLAGALLLGFFIASIFTGLALDYMGRKDTIYIILFLICLGTAIFNFSDIMSEFYVGRVIQGIGFGASLIALPIYLTETTPFDFRGKIVTLYRLNVTVGIFLSSVLGLLFFNDSNWHILILSVMIFPIIVFIVIQFLPESPHFLMSHKNYHLVKESLKKIYSTPWEVEDRYVHLFNHPTQKLTVLENIKILKQKHMVKGLLIVIFAVCINQLAGVNFFLQCSFAVIHVSGIVSQSIASIAGILFTAVHCVGTFIAFILVEKIGRKPILKIGTTGLFITFIFLAILHLIFPVTMVMGVITIIGIIVMLGFFGFGSGGVLIVICTEILPIQLRSIGISISYFFATIIGIFFTSNFVVLSHALGLGVLFLIMAIATSGYFIVLAKIPETK